MTEFDNLKRSYSLAIQMGLAAGCSYEDCKIANEFIHKFCENYIDNSSNDSNDKRIMKIELKALKETISKEIENCFQHEK